MDKFTFYRNATWFLLLINLVLLTFHILPHLSPSGPTRGMEQALEKLELDAEQRVDFRRTAEEHQEHMRRIDAQQRSELQSYFTPLTNDQGSTTRDVSQAYLMLSEEKVKTTYQHFLEVKAMLKPEQQELYKDWVRTAVQGILFKNPEPPKD